LEELDAWATEETFSRKDYGKTSNSHRKGVDVKGVIGKMDVLRKKEVGKKIQKAGLYLAKPKKLT